MVCWAANILVSKIGLSPFVKPSRRKTVAAGSVLSFRRFFAFQRREVSPYE